MRQPLLDLDLKRVTREHYITGKAAINFPSFGGTTGGWHSMAYWDRDTGTSKVSLAGIHYSDTKAFFGDVGIFDATMRSSVSGGVWMGKLSGWRITLGPPLT
ncbi:hypothetical protein [Pseudomonas bubulae]|uniref:hypothetical protein n=1 Tax=Pseudomonas bubulae TaxID=2316085 RepID=UPI0030978680